MWAEYHLSPRSPFYDPLRRETVDVLTGHCMAHRPLSCILVAAVQNQIGEIVTDVRAFPRIVGKDIRETRPEFGHRVLELLPIVCEIHLRTPGECVNCRAVGTRQAPKMPGQSRSDGGHVGGINVEVVEQIDKKPLRARVCVSRGRARYADCRIPGLPVQGSFRLRRVVGRWLAEKLTIACRFPRSKI